MKKLTVFVICTPQPRLVISFIFGYFINLLLFEQMSSWRVVHCPEQSQEELLSTLTCWRTLHRKASPYALPHRSWSWRKRLNRTKMSPTWLILVSVAVFCICECCLCFTCLIFTTHYYRLFLDREGHICKFVVILDVYPYLLFLFALL